MVSNLNTRHYKLKISRNSVGEMTSKARVILSVSKDDAQRPLPAYGSTGSP